MTNRLADHPRAVSALFTTALLLASAAPAVADSSGSTGGPSPESIADPITTFAAALL